MNTNEVVEKMTFEDKHPRRSGRIVEVVSLNKAPEGGLISVSERALGGRRTTRIAPSRLLNPSRYALVSTGSHCPAPVGA